MVFGIAVVFTIGFRKEAPLSCIFKHRERGVRINGGNLFL